jgi:hypothetical protein
MDNIVVVPMDSSGISRLSTQTGVTHSAGSPSCMICGGLTKKWKHIIGGMWNAYDLVHSAGSKCKMCKMLLMGIRKFFPEWGLPRHEAGYESQFSIHATEGSPLSILLAFLKQIPVVDMGNVARELSVEFYRLESNVPRKRSN